jgi:hypothetical protein
MKELNSNLKIEILILQSTLNVKLYIYILIIKIYVHHLIHIKN